MDDIPALFKGGVNRKVAEAAKKVRKKLREEVEKEGLKMSEEQDDRVMWLPGR